MLHVLRRPYHAGSLLIPPPKQDISPEQTAAWVVRIRAYWPRGNQLAHRVAKALVGFLGPEGELMPSLKTLADSARCAPRTVSRWVEKFAAVGFVRKINRRLPFFQGQTSNAYLILQPSDAEPQTVQPSPAHEPAAELSVYNTGEESAEADSMDSWDRPSALRRLNRWLGTVVKAVRPAPQPPRFTPQEQIALLALPTAANWSS